MYLNGESWTYLRALYILGDAHKRSLPEETVRILIALCSTSCLDLSLYLQRSLLRDKPTNDMENPRPARDRMMSILCNGHIGRRKDLLAEVPEGGNFDGLISDYLEVPKYLVIACLGERAAGQLVLYVGLWSCDIESSGCPMMTSMHPETIDVNERPVKGIAKERNGGDIERIQFQGDTNG